MAKTLLPGYHLASGTAKRMITPTGENISYYAYRNQASQQKSGLTYNQYRNLGKDAGYNAKLNAVAQKIQSETGKDLEKIKRDLRKTDSAFNYQFAQFQKEVKAGRTGTKGKAANILRQWGMKDDYEHKVGDTPRKKKGK